jgi:type I restriction enzyme S subunit
MSREVTDSGIVKKIESEILDSIPKSWIQSTLGECFTWGSGGTPKSSVSKYYNGSIPWLVIGDLNDSVVTSAGQFITEEGLCNSSAKLIEPGTLLLAMYGSIGKLGIAGVKLATNQAIAFALANIIDTKYLFYFLRFARPHLNDLGKGATQLNISQTVIKSFPFPLPPINEQKRIVAKIEELFSELDNGVAALKTAREQLKVYRQAVLKHAFEGKLTAQWRAENQDKLESPEQLLTRIQQEREARYQQQLEEWEIAVKEWEAKGKEGKKPGRSPKARSPIQIQEADFNVPDEWAVAELADIAYESVLGKMLDKQKNVGLSRPYLGNINVRWGKFDLDELKTMRIEESELKRYSLVHGDLVICEGGEPGRCAVWQGDDDTIFIQKALHRVRFTESYSPKFAFYYMTYAVPLERVVKNFTGTTIKHLTGAGLSKVQFPVCTLDEQIEVVSVLEARLSEIDQLEAEVAAQLLKAETLRQSILKKAFSGLLVPQDPNDEPASELLARIKAEKVAQKAAEKAQQAAGKKPAAKRGRKLREPVQ